MSAVILSLQAFHSHVFAKHVCVRIDNMTAVADMGKMGTSHSRQRSALSRAIWEWCLQHNVFPTTTHIAGKENSKRMSNLENHEKTWNGTEISRAIWDWCLQHNVLPTTTHIASKENSKRMSNLENHKKTWNGTEPKHI